MIIKVSSEGYKIKPGGREVASITESFKHSSTTKETNFEQLASYLESGHSVLLAEFKKDGSIFEDNIRSINCIALDIDSKENKITMMDMISLVLEKISIYPIIAYRTFSDEDFTRFRLIYRFEKSIDTEVYRAFYNALVWKLGKYIDRATINPNRIWAGTNKKVLFMDDKPITFPLLCTIIKRHNDKLNRDKKKEKQKIKERMNNIKSGVVRIEGNYIKKEYREEVTDLLINSINLKDFIEKHLGGNFKRKNNIWSGRCVIHDGDNPGALVIYEKTYRCFTHCGTGNVITIAKKVYNTEYFSEVVFKLADEYNLCLKDEYIARWV